MRIGIDARFWDESGIGRYLRNLIKNLSDIDKENEYIIFLLNKNLDINLPSNFKKIEANFKWYGIDEQIKFPRLLNKYKVDLMHFPHFNVPLFYRGKFVVTIHDLIHQHFDMSRSTTLNPLVHSFKKMGYKKVFSSAINKSQKIITPSEYTKSLLNKEYLINPDKIFVTPEGVDDYILELIKSYKDEDFRYVNNKFNINSKYLFYVGNAHPHKNIERLIEVFNQINQEIPDIKLVLSGKNNYFWERVLKTTDNKNVIFTGFITDEEMVSLYKNAEAFIMPSLEEGFGIPILEAFACGTPVVSSDAGSLEEVGGNAALFFNPNDALDMKAQILKVLNGKDLKLDLIKKGKERVKEFSWKKMAIKTVDLYNSINERVN